jgi:hypothetical protein
MRADNVERIIVDSVKKFIYVLMYRQVYLIYFLYFIHLI